MIQLKKIDKYYDAKFQRTFVLKGVNLEVKLIDGLVRDDYPVEIRK